MSTEIDPRRARQPAPGSRSPALAGRTGPRLGRVRPASAPAIAEALRSDAELGRRFAHWERRPARAERSAPLPAALDPRLVELFRSRAARPRSGATRRARSSSRSTGRDVLVATPTASGKTLCYDGARCCSACSRATGAARAMFLFPTKALSPGPVGGLERADRGRSARTGTASPTTATRRRRCGARCATRGHVRADQPLDAARRASCPTTPSGAELFRGLRYVVIDEVHTLSGVFGSSVANVLRRLVRIARHYGARAALPAGLGHAARAGRARASACSAATSRSSTRTARPRASALFGVYNPPLLDPVAGLRANALEEARRLALRRVRPRTPDDLLLQPAHGGRGADALPEGGRARARASRPTRSAATAAATCRSCGARSRTGCARARSRSS